MPRQGGIRPVAAIGREACPCLRAHALEQGELGLGLIHLDDLLCGEVVPGGGIVENCLEIAAADAADIFHQDNVAAIDRDVGRQIGGSLAARLPCRNQHGEGEKAVVVEEVERLAAG